MSEELLKTRQEKLEALKKSGVDPYPYGFERSRRSSDVLEKYQALKEGEESEDEVSLAGRIMTRRDHGKSSFAHLQDEAGKIQIYAKQDVVGNEPYAVFQQLDLGDIIGVRGKVFKTRTGEVTVRVTGFDLLCKSLHPLPEKWHGLQDKELRYRERYVDLIVNPQVKEVFLKRSKIISLIRKFLEGRGFLEVETPILHVLQGGAAAKPFETFHDALAMDLFLRIAPELYLKRLLVGGFEKVFELGRVFRNEGISYKHNPEYTILEVYQAHIDYEAIMKLTEEMVAFLCQQVLGGLKLKYKEEDINFTPPWQRISFFAALKNQGIDLEGKSEKEIRAIAKKKELEGYAEIGIGKIIAMLYDKCVEPNLRQPTFIVDYPLETTPLAKKKRGNPKLVERFELIVAGMELANAFSELNDPLDQRQRLKEQQQLRKAGDVEAESLDEDFLRALEYGMPPAGGLGIGVDRLVMLLTNQSSIRDVLFFPHMRPASNEGH